MRKIITYLLLSYGIITASFAQQDSTLLLLDKTEITTNLLYPHFSNDSSAFWLQHNGVNQNLASSRKTKQAYLELTNYFIEPHTLPSINTLIKNAEYEINVNKRIPIMVLDFDYNLLLDSRFHGKLTRKINLLIN